MFALLVIACGGTQHPASLPSEVTGLVERYRGDAAVQTELHKLDEMK